MKKFVTKFVSILCIASMAMAFCSCSSKKKTLVMATNAAFPPYEYTEGGRIVGIDAEIAEAIAKKLDMELKIEDVEFGSIIGGVVSGKYDIGMAGMTVTDERLESVNFSNTYATGIQSIIIVEGSEVTDLDTLIAGDYLVGTQESTTGDIYMQDEIGSDRVQSYKTGADAVLALTTGKVSAVVIDNEPAKAFVEANPGLVILDTPYAVEDYAIAISKNNTQLLDDVNKALEELTADGTIDAIISKYIPAN